jgi:hypothetical protein
MERGWCVPTKYNFYHFLNYLLKQIKISPSCQSIKLKYLLMVHIEELCSDGGTMDALGNLNGEIPWHETQSRPQQAFADIQLRRIP